jgi:hypothetical protein
MALHFRLMVNEEAIAYFYAQRQGDVDEAGIGTYEVTFLDQRRSETSFTMTHPYSAGAWPLVGKATRELGRRQRPEPVSHEYVRQVNCAWCGSENVQGVSLPYAPHAAVMHYRCHVCGQRTKMDAPLEGGGKVYILKYGKEVPA